MTYDKVHELCPAIQASDEYRTYIRLKEDVMADETTAALIKEYRRLQVTLQMAMVSGNSGSQEDMQRFSGITSLLFSKPEVAQFMESEMYLQRMLAGIFNELTKAADVTYSNLIQYINDHFTDPMFSMNEVAEHLGVSIYTASRMLKTLTGINFRKYLNDMRIEYARDLLLSTDLSVNDIAAQAGFTSPSYFISIFKKDENTTPSNFRKQHDEED